MNNTPVVKRPRRFAVWLRIPETAKPRIYQQVAANATYRSLLYWLGIVFSSVIATLGLVLNSPAVIIGAMLISPLMGPIMSAGMALATGDVKLTLRSIATLFASICAAVAFSAALVWVLPFHAPTPEILARTNPTLLDLAIAIASGLAGSVATARGGVSDEGATALPGVAIAVALMPPLCTVGFGVGNGFDVVTITGAGLLFLTNLVAIVASAFLVFLLVGLEIPEEAGAEGATQESHLMAAANKLHWRVLTLVALLVLIAIPLRRSLTQVVTEARDRSTIQEGLHQLAQGSDLVSQKVSLGKENIDVELMTTRAVAGAKVHDIEQWIGGRTGKATRLKVTEVASRAEILDLLKRANEEQKSAAAPPPPTEPKIAEDARKEREFIGDKLSGVWPSDKYPVSGFDLTFQADKVLLRVDYAAAHTISSDAVNVIEQQMQKATQTPALALEARRVPPARHR